jgi:coproporphyrinogen III oxidase
MSGLFDRAAQLFRGLQADITQAVAAADGGAEFSSDPWTREGGGGGVARVLEGGAVFEKAGVNWSSVEGELPADFAKTLPGEGRHFRASGVSLVLHPRSPMIPTTHANFRCLEKGDRLWFGGGADLTPYYLWREDAVHFHRTLADVCDRHRPVADYDRFKTWCDDYFFLPHRGETRGVGGIFFDYLGAPDHDPEAVFPFVGAAGAAFIQAYLPIVERRRAEPWGEDQRRWQTQRRGRYVEFNLIHDRGTIFGLKTGGRTESILMSLPPVVRWDYQAEAAPDTREAELVAALVKGTRWIERPGGQ